jgi:molybdenum cofactor cytidylyltransferase
VTLIRGILLAGGAASRFGSQKLLHKLADGEAIGEKSARHFHEAIGNALAVVRPGSDELKSMLLRVGCEVLETERALEGMGGSLAAAIASLDRADGYVVALADMPFIEVSSIRAVRDALLAGASIAIPAVDGERGHPVGFSAEWTEALRGLSGDEGARRIVSRQAERVTEVAVNDQNIRRDIDTPQDL